MILLIALLTTHLIADFYLQSRRIGENKASSPLVMLEHIGIMFCAFAITGVYFLGIKEGLALAFLNAVIHWIIDQGLATIYMLSVLMRHPEAGDNPFGFLNSWKIDLKYVKDKIFWDTVGSDQYLHILTIILLYSKFIF